MKLEIFIRVLAGFMVFSGVALTPACSGSAEDETAAAAPLPVRTSRATLSTRPRHQELAATVRPRDHAIVAARASGTINGADFTLGQGVSAGEVLLTLESAEATVAIAEAALAQIAGDLARESSLLAKGASASETVRSLADQRRRASRRRPRPSRLRSRHRAF